MQLTDSCFKIIWYAEIKNVLIKEGVEICQKEVTTKDFYGQRQITDTFTIDINKVVISNKVSCNNGKDCRYIEGYQVDGGLVPLFIKTPKNMFSYGVSQ